MIKHRGTVAEITVQLNYTLIFFILGFGLIIMETPAMRHANIALTTSVDICTCLCVKIKNKHRK